MHPHTDQKDNHCNNIARRQLQALPLPPIQVPSQLNPDSDGMPMLLTTLRPRASKLVFCPASASCRVPWTGTIYIYLVIITRVVIRGRNRENDGAPSSPGPAPGPTPAQVTGPTPTRNADAHQSAVGDPAQYETGARADISFYSFSG